MSILFEDFVFSRDTPTHGGGGAGGWVESVGESAIVYMSSGMFRGQMNLQTELN